MRGKTATGAEAMGAALGGEAGPRPAVALVTGAMPLAPLPTSLDLDAAGTQVLDQVQEHVLATKFFVPASPHALIPRPHLDSLLHEGLRRQLTLVSAPAGFGKTTGLSHWVHSLPQGTLENHRVAWVSLDEADKCAVRFWTYVLTALDKSEPGVATPALQLLQLHASCSGAGAHRLDQCPEPGDTQLCADP